jgi:hypothetical protein
MVVFELEDELMAWVNRPKKTCDERAYYKDIWIGSRLKSVYDGRK